MKLRIRQNNNILGEWWTCYKPSCKGEFFLKSASGKTPNEAYVNYFNPVCIGSGVRWAVLS